MFDVLPAFLENLLGIGHAVIWTCPRSLLAVRGLAGSGAAADIPAFVDRFLPGENDRWDCDGNLDVRTAPLLGILPNYQGIIGSCFLDQNGWLLNRNR